MGEHAGYLIAGYGATWAVLLWYLWRLRKRTARAAEAVERRDEDPERDGDDGV